MTGKGTLGGGGRRGGGGRLGGRGRELRGFDLGGLARTKGRGGRSGVEAGAR